MNENFESAGELDLHLREADLTSSLLLCLTMGRMSVFLHSYYTDSHHHQHKFSRPFLGGWLSASDKPSSPKCVSSYRAGPKP